MTNPLLVPYEEERLSSVENGPIHQLLTAMTSRLEGFRPPPPVRAFLPWETPRAEPQNIVIPLYDEGTLITSFVEGYAVREPDQMDQTTGSFTLETPDRNNPIYVPIAKTAPQIWSMGTDIRVIPPAPPEKPYHGCIAYNEAEEWLAVSECTYRYRGSGVGFKVVIYDVKTEKAVEVKLDLGQITNKFHAVISGAVFARAAAKELLAKHQQLPKSEPDNTLDSSVNPEVT